MKTINIINITDHQTVQTNPFYDPDLSRNGGGYYQPTHTIKLSNGGTLVIDDTSCGDFGERYDITYTDPNGRKYGYHFDQVSNPNCPDDWEWGDLDICPDFVALEPLINEMGHSCRAEFYGFTAP